MDRCGVCGGDNTTCRLVSGVFKHSLSKIGYHKIVEIPEGATKINVTEMVKSRNYLGGKNTLVTLILHSTASAHTVFAHVCSFTAEKPKLRKAFSLLAQEWFAVFKF